MERILQLAPQPLLIDRARLLLHPKRWALLACHTSVVWGLCRTKGATQYKVAFDLQAGQGFSNSPSPAKPDKYILALLLFFFEDPSSFTFTQFAPDWVSDGLAHPPSPREPDSEGPSLPRLSSFEKRIPLMAQGQQELAQWLRDMARQGLGALQAAELSVWESIATRLTDAKLSGLAGRLRRLAMQRHHPDWDRLFRQELAALHLWSEAFARLDDYPEAMQQELMLQGGWTPRKEDVQRESEGIVDQWFVLQHTTGAEEQLAFQRTWYWGQKTGRTALLLEYAWGNIPFENTWTVGAGYEGTMYFYPGTFPLRAVPGSLIPSHTPFEPTTGLFEHIGQLGDAFAEAVGRQPWLQELPCGFRAVSVVLCEERPFLCDRMHYRLPLAPDRADLFPDFSPHTVFGTWDGIAFYPWAIWKNNQWITR